MIQERTVEEKIRTSRQLACLAALAAVLLPCAVSATNLDGSESLGDYEISNVTVVDAIGGARPNQRVVTQGDRILWVGPMNGGGPKAHQTIDGSNRFVIPGLWDAHVHFLYDPQLTDAMASLFLDFGITSVRDTGGDLDPLVALRKQFRTPLKNGGIEAPRLFFAGPLLDGARIVYDGATASRPKLGTAVPDAETARAKVRWLKAAGADFIKIYELVSPEVFSALVAEASALNLPIASHVPLSLVADIAGPQTGSMEHLRNIELACAADWRERWAARRDRMESFGDGSGYELRRELHKRQRQPAIAAYDAERCEEVLDSLRGTVQVPTLRLNAFNRSRPDISSEWKSAVNHLPLPVQRRWNTAAAKLETADVELDMRFADWSLFLVGKMLERGVPVAAGTDTPIKLAIPGESLHRELELLVRSGMTPRQALEAATLTPARFFSLENEMGQVAEGMRADLVLLGANPLVDIRNTRKIEGVLSQGRWRD